MKCGVSPFNSFLATGISGCLPHRMAISFDEFYDNKYKGGEEGMPRP
jgi:hypothetical protein